MSRLSIVIFGATGFTGKHAALEMVTLAKKHPGLTWGVAGRSQSKLEDLIRDISKTTGENLSQQVKIIVADVFDEESLKAMCRQTKVIANCCGPYRLYGEPVVKAAIESHTHYVDVTAEPQFVETIRDKYDGKAREAGVHVITSCGFDSIPNDMGVVFLQQNFGGTLNSVESYICTSIAPQHGPELRRQGAANYGTWKSFIYVLEHWDELKPVEEMLMGKLPALEPKLVPRCIIHRRNKGWCVPFLGADNFIVNRTQQHLYSTDEQRQAQFKVYVRLDYLLEAVALIIGAFIFTFMARFSFTRNLLLNHPRIFSAGYISRKGPTEEVLKNSSFQMRLYGKGWQEGTEVSKPMDKAVTAKVSGTELGYGATVVCLLYSAITVLEEADKIPGKGGVLTTGVAFKDTNLIKHLHENGLKFEIIQSAAIQ